MMISNKVKEQYETYPYPPRDETDINSNTGHDNLFKICSRAGWSLDRLRNMKILVAGCGTGDAVVYLIKQYIDFIKSTNIMYNIEVHALDFCSKSLKICEQRCKYLIESELDQVGNVTKERIRDQIKFYPVVGSIMDIENIYETNYFDYINVSGVLHHLENPTLGLQKLKDIMKNTGMMFVMLYAPYGRHSTYLIQMSMKKLLKKEDDLQNKFNILNKVLESCKSNPNNPYNVCIPHDEKLYGKCGALDQYLHNQDRPYDVRELRDLFDSVSMIFDFADKRQYELSRYIPEELIDRNLDYYDRAEIAEMIDGSIFKHSLYAYKDNYVIEKQDPEYLICFFDKGIILKEIEKSMENKLTFTKMYNGMKEVRTIEITEQLTDFIRNLKHINKCKDVIGCHKEMFELLLDLEMAVLI